jgi:hypothetical protein
MMMEAGAEMGYDKAKKMRRRSLLDLIKGPIGWINRIYFLKLFVFKNLNLNLKISQAVFFHRLYLYFSFFLFHFISHLL